MVLYIYKIKCAKKIAVLNKSQLIEEVEFGPCTAEKLRKLYYFLKYFSLYQAM